MLVKELLRKTPEGHPEFVDLTKALAEISSSAQKINEEMKNQVSLILLCPEDLPLIPFSSAEDETLLLSVLPPEHAHILSSDPKIRKGAARCG